MIETSVLLPFGDATRAAELLRRDLSADRDPKSFHFFSMWQIETSL